MLPFMKLDRLGCLNANAKIAPAMDDMHAQFTVEHIQAMTHPLKIIVRSRQNSAIERFRLDPGAVSKGFQVFEISRMPIRLQVMLFVKGLSQAGRPFSAGQL